MQSRGAFMAAGGGPCVPLDACGAGAYADGDASTAPPALGGGDKWHSLLAAAKSGASASSEGPPSGPLGAPYGGGARHHPLMLGGAATFGPMGDAGGGFACSQPLSSPTYEESSSGSFAFFSSPYAHAAGAPPAGAPAGHTFHVLAAPPEDAALSGASFAALDGIMSNGGGGGGAGGGGFATAPAAFGAAGASFMDAGDVETLYPSERLALARMAAAAQQQQQQRQQQQRQQQQQAQAQAQQKQAAMLMHSGPAALAAAAANGDDVFALGGFAMDQRPCGGLLSPAGLLGKRGGGGSGAALAAAGGGGSGQQLIPKSSSLYVKNLPLDADKCFLYERFAPYGAIMSVKVLCDSDTKVCRGVGFVNFAQHDDAARAMQALHGTKIGDRLLHVSLQTPRIRAVV